MFLESFRFEVDDDGVWTGDWVSRPEEGEAVPSFESLFFLDDLPSLLPRESYLGQDETVSQRSGGLSVVTRARQDRPCVACWARICTWWKMELTTLWLKRFMPLDQGRYPTMVAASSM